MRRSLFHIVTPLFCAAAVSACSGGATSGAMPAYHPAISSATASANATPVATSTQPASALAGVNATPASATTAPTVAPTKAPTPVPTAVPTAAPTAMPTVAPSATVAAQFPIFSNYFTGRTPFHIPAATLMAQGATVDSPTIAANYWSQGLNNFQPLNQSAGASPLYYVHSGDPSYVFECPEYGGCPAAGMVVHYPAGAVPSQGSDHHLVSFDPTYLQGEVDGWGGYGCSGNLLSVVPTGSCAHPCNLSSGSPGTTNCSWGGFTPFSGSGLGNGGDAAAYAYGLFQVTAQELLNGQINHALGIVQSCLDNNGVFPAGRTTSDSLCPQTGNAEPNASYGEMIHLKSNVNVASLGYSPYCQTIVQALQTYGAYTVDTNGGYGLTIETEDIDNPLYAQNNPWTNTIFPSIVAGGDGSGSGTSFSFQSCLQRIPASDIEIVDIVNDGSYQTSARSRNASRRS
jgi:hypothetical protein